MQQPDFDSRSYRYAKLSDLIAATTLFDLERRSTLLLAGEARVQRDYQFVEPTWPHRPSRFVDP
jgi:hypothetical protein